MTFMLIEAEMARQQQQLLCIQYQPRDRAVSANASPQGTRRTTQLGGGADRAQSANELRHRFSTRYNWDRLNCSDPLQYLVSELCQINLMKYKFINRSSQGRVPVAPTSTPIEHSEVSRYARPIYSSQYAIGQHPILLFHTDMNSIFHEALQLATRCVALAHQYSNSPYSWYTRRIREIYSSSFLAMVLASDRPISHEDTNAAWAVLNQLFSTDANGNTLDSGVQDTLLGKVLEKARTKRGLQIQAPVVHHLREQTMHASTGNYPPQLLPHPVIPASANSGNAFQTSGNLFEDWDALMQEPVWSGGIPVTDTNYWV